MEPAWCSQLTTVSLLPPSHLCQLTATKLLQDNIGGVPFFTHTPLPTLATTAAVVPGLFCLEFSAVAAAGRGDVCESGTPWLLPPPHHPPVTTIPSFFGWELGAVAVTAVVRRGVGKRETSSHHCHSALCPLALPPASHGELSLL